MPRLQTRRIARTPSPARPRPIGDALRAATLRLPGSTSMRACRVPAMAGAGARHASCPCAWHGVATRHAAPPHACMHARPTWRVVVPRVAAQHLRQVAALVARVGPLVGADDELQAVGLQKGLAGAGGEGGRGGDGVLAHRTAVGRWGPTHASCYNRTAVWLPATSIRPSAPCCATLRKATSAPRTERNMRASGAVCVSNGMQQLLPGTSCIGIVDTSAAVARRRCSHGSKRRCMRRPPV